MKMWMKGLSSIRRGLAYAWPLWSTGNAAKQASLFHHWLKMSQIANLSLPNPSLNKVLVSAPIYSVLKHQLLTQLKQPRHSVCRQKSGWHLLGKAPRPWNSAHRAVHGRYSFHRTEYGWSWRPVFLPSFRLLHRGLIIPWELFNYPSSALTHIKLEDSWNLKYTEHWPSTFINELGGRLLLSKLSTTRGQSRVQFFQSSIFSYN